MDDKTNDTQEKIETAIDSKELRDEELDSVNGGWGFMKLGGIEGEATNEGHNKWIDVLSVDFEFHKPRS